MRGIYAAGRCVKLPYGNISVTSVETLEQAARECGLLPFFRSGVPGFSVEDMTPPRYWFASDADGPWEWRMETARRGEIAYAKLFAGKAGFCTMEYYPDLANCRRDGYDFDARYEDGLADHRDKQIIDALAREGPLLTSALRRASGVTKGFETCLTRLQMQTYITVMDFEYLRDRHGAPYGWGVARYALSESVFGADVTRSAYSRPPAVSRERLMERLRALCPDAGEKALAKLLK